MTLKQWLKTRLFRAQFAGLIPALANRPVFPEPLALNPHQRCLVLAPHPDDEILGCGGLLLSYPGQCDVVCLTNGALGGEGLSRAETVAIRRSEFESAMALAGI